MALPSDIASTKARLTRASVAPRCRNSAPLDASAMTTSSTAGGEGSFAAPTNSAAVHQIASNRANDRRRSTSVSGNCVIERSWLEFSGRANEVASAGLGQHAVEHARVLFFVIDAPARNAVAIALAIGLEQGGIVRAGERCDLVPGSIRGHQQLLGPASHRDEARHSVPMARRPALVEDIADCGDGALGAELRQNVLDAGEASKALRLQLCAEIPEVEACIHLAVERLGGDQGRSPIDDSCLRFQVDAVLLQARLEQQPALVDGTTADRELAALQIGERPDRRGSR